MSTHISIVKSLVLKSNREIKESSKANKGLAYKLLKLQQERVVRVSTI